MITYIYTSIYSNAKPNDQWQRL